MMINKPSSFMSRMLEQFSEIHFIMCGEAQYPEQIKNLKFYKLARRQRSALSKLARQQFEQREAEEIFNEFQCIFEDFKQIDEDCNTAKKNTQSQNQTPQTLEAKLSNLLKERAEKWNVSVKEVTQTHRDYLMYAAFEVALTIHDSGVRDLRLAQQAQVREIDITQYIELFKIYKFERQKYCPKPLSEHWGHFWEAKSQMLDNGSMLQFLAKLGGFSLLIGLVIFLFESPRRTEQNEIQKRQESYAAWTLIANIEDKKIAAGGMISALEDLSKGCRNKYQASHDHTYGILQIGNNIPLISGWFPDFECQEIRKIDLTGAHLPRVQLQGSKLYAVILREAGLWEADLRGADLSESWLKRAKLNNAKLQKAVLRGASLTEADLNGASLTEADLTGANLIDTDLSKVESLSGANLKDMLYSSKQHFPEGTDLSAAILVGPGTNLKSADLEGHNLARINLTRINLRGANLRHANLQEADLTGANLIDADLSRANLSGAILNNVYYSPGTDFPEGTDLSEAIKLAPDTDLKSVRLAKKDLRRILKQVDLKEFRLDTANLSEANLSEGNLAKAILTKANLVKANLTGANLIDADLSKANLSGAILDKTLYSPETDFPAGTDLSKAVKLAPSADLKSAQLEDYDLEGVDLQEADLTAANLQGANLTEANLTEATLKESNLRGTNLSGVDLAGANLAGVTLREANLAGATLTNANLAGANLINADLVEITDLSTVNVKDMLYSSRTRFPEGTDLSGAIFIGFEANLESVQLEGYNLAGVYLQAANLKDANLTEVNLQGANLVEATLERASLKTANLKGADLKGANLKAVDLKGANLRAVDLKGVNLKGANLTNANLIDVDLLGVESLSRAQLDNVFYSPKTRFPGGIDLSRAIEIAPQANLESVELKGYDLAKVDLSEANLRGTDLRGASLQAANLTDADLSEANLRGTDLRGASLQAANLTNTDLSNGDLSRADLSNADLRNVDLRNADLRNIDLTGAQLAGADLAGARLAGAKNLTVEQVRQANNWDKAIYDAPMIRRLRAST